MQPTCLRSLVAILGLAVAAMPLAASGDGGAGQPSSPPGAAGAAASVAKPPAGTRCQTSPSCDKDCSNLPPVPTDCWTTEYGPAKADVVISSGNTGMKSTNMLYCPAARYALCFFSGPATPTGKNCPGTNCTNQPLPCVVDRDNPKIANCTCKAYTSPYFVDINGILNLGVYYQTINACGVDGSLCYNIVNIDNCSSSNPVPGCLRLKQAPVCDYVKNQNPSTPSASLWPKADLISTFGFKMEADYPLGSTPCPPPGGQPKGPYAGCMTAPCTFGAASGSQRADGDTIQCKCPIYDGPYQVGQDGQSCTIPPSGGNLYVWSGSYTVTASSATAKQPKQ
jgi:hypothetical protein